MIHGTHTAAAAPRLDPGSNFGRYQTSEFGSWASRDRLIPAEDLLISRFLDPAGATVDAGTGGGCIALDLQRRGFRRVAGFDFVPDLVARARQRDASRAIDFTVQDATALEYEDGAFEQAIYLQQLLCFIEDEGQRWRALREAHRILAPGGTALFSFLCLEARLKKPALRAYVAYLSTLRRVIHRDVPVQLQPWLRKGRRISPDALLDRGARVYWYRLREASELLECAGFEVVAAGSTGQLQQGTMFADHRHLDEHNVDGMAYFVCRR
jgi:SAM-dependent methyltransferase